jgi:hypothetical protein
VHPFAASSFSRQRIQWNESADNQKSSSSMLL